MFKKALSIFGIGLGIGIVAISTSRPIMKYINTVRDDNKWWGTYQCGNGDLVSMCYLDNTKFRRIKDRTVIKPTYNGSKKVNLFLFGDSYSHYIYDTAFLGVNYYYRNDRYPKCIVYKLDNTKKNILLIEIVEREFREYFSDFRMYNAVCDSEYYKKEYIADAPNNSTLQDSGNGWLLDILFNKFINQNIQCNLFNYNFFLPVFETKATFNFYFFNRASGDVVISKNREFLLYKETVFADGNKSSFSPISDNEVESYIDRLNEIYTYYRDNGFDEIYLTLIPSTVTIVQPDGYNNLIPKIQNHPKLKMKFFDVYSYFKTQPPKKYFYIGDTHWNREGRQIWLDMVNKKLEEWNK